jgi:glycosyltransferase involved in cell wall biosynthesis
VVAAPALGVLPYPRIPTICHVHELGFSFANRVPKEDLALLLDRTTRYVACSEAVADYLRVDRRVPGASIDVVHEFLLPASARGTSLGGVPPVHLPGKGPIVGTVGTVDWRKGTDLFLQMAVRMQRRALAEPPRFLWIGGGEPEERARVRHDLQSAGLEGNVTILGSVEDPTPFYRMIDIFLLPSREDPFPLVCLEAAAAAKPIVCFAGAGGAPELVEPDCGFVVPYLDLDAMTERLHQLLEDAELRSQMGENARRKVHERYTIERMAPKLSGAIELVLESSARPR